MTNSFKDQYGPWAIITGANTGIDATVPRRARKNTPGATAHTEHA